MFIEIKRYTRNRFKFIQFVRVDEMPTDGKRYIRHDQLNNWDTRLEGGSRYITILQGYSLMMPNCIIRVAPGEFRIDISLNKIKRKKKLQLENQTRRYIASDSPNEKRMPEWRQIKLRDYLDMYERKVTRARSLGPFQQEIYDSMVDPLDGETENSVQTGAITAFRWIMECRRVHRVMVRQLKAMTNMEELLRFDVTSCPYPAWVDI